MKLNIWKMTSFIFLIPIFFFLGLYLFPFGGLLFLKSEWRIQKAIQYAIENKGDLSYCDKFGEETAAEYGHLRSRCYRFYAQKTNNNKICDLIPDAGQADYCYEKLKTSVDSCFKIKNPGIIGNCLSSFVSQSPIECDVLSGNKAVIRRACYLNFIPNRFGVDPCYQIKINDPLRDLCYYFSAEFKKDIDICRRINDNFRRGTCVARIELSSNSVKKNLYLCAEKIPNGESEMKKGCYGELFFSVDEADCKKLDKTEQELCLDGIMTNCSRPVLEENSELIVKKDCYHRWLNKYGIDICERAPIEEKQFCHEVVKQMYSGPR
jgi:hypothetical protein